MKTFENFTIDQREKLIRNDLTYIRKNTTINTYNELNSITRKIKDYDFSGFRCFVMSYEVLVYVDDEFRKLIKELNEIYNTKIIINRFDLFVNTELLNVIDLEFSLPSILRGLNIGYKIYKLMVNEFEYITSDHRIKLLASNIWYKLMIDEDYYSFTSKICSGVINKNISDIKLKEILIKIKNNVYIIYKINFENLIFDDELTEKLIEWKL